MPLGLLAKDSIQDLEALARGDDQQQQPSGGTSKLSLAVGSSDPGFVAAFAIASPDDCHPDEESKEQAPLLSPAHSFRKSGSLSTDGDDDNNAAADGDASSSAGYDANPQQAQEDDVHSSSRSSVRKRESLNHPPPQLYEGFRSDYDAYREYTEGTHAYEFYDQHHSVDYLGEKKPLATSRSFLDCIFPCLFAAKDDKDEEDLLMHQQHEALDQEQQLQQSLSLTTDGAGGIPRSTSRDEDEVSTNSDLLGERLSEKERQAVLARLRLAQPDVDQNQNADPAGPTSPSETAAFETSGQSPPFDTKNEDSLTSSPSMTARTVDGDAVKKRLPHKGLLNGIPTYDQSPLEACQDAEEQADLLLAEERKPLRSILKRRSTVNVSAAAQSAASEASKGGGGSVGSSSAPRRSLFPSYGAKPPKRRDADHPVSFAPMARVVTIKSKNDMDPQEKGDIWWQKSDYEDFRRTGRIITKAMLEGGSEIWLTASCSKNPDGSDDEDEDAKESAADTKDPGDKWWHRFGHSRRGLEHVVSVEEGRQRQMNVRNAIHSVLEEQLRQKRYRREDDEKLRIVSLNHTSWARDLALASGASDADAVRSSFAQDRKTREFFLLKLARNCPVQNLKRRVPEFMQPALSVAKAKASPAAVLSAQKLDANTAAQIRFRHDQEREGEGEAAAAANSKVTSEPVRDVISGEAADKKESMKQRAMGFSAEGSAKVDMAAVLSGMGAVPQTHSPTPVSAPS